MSKRHPRARWILPTVISPSTSTCYQVPVPDDPFYKAAFLGALETLGMAASWQRDPDHKASEVAAVWRNIQDNLETCMDIRLRNKPTDFCALQLSTDGGVTWADVADFSDCANAAVVAGVDQAIADGRIGGIGQPPPGGDGAPSICYDYDVTLQGNGRWQSPLSLEAGDIITVTNAQGGWFDDFGLAWNCPDGSEYALGHCLTGGQGFHSGDPIDTVYHMRLIGNLPEDGTTPFFDLYNQAYTVPTGVVAGSLFLQANDDVLTDNQGSIQLHVQICKGGFSHTFDFASADGGWVAAVAGSPCSGTLGEWTSGQGWNASLAECFGSTQNYTFLAISKAFAHRVIKSVKVTFNRVAGAQYNSGDIDAIAGSLSGTGQFTQAVDYRSPPTSPWEWVGSKDCDSLSLSLIAGVCNGASCAPGGSVRCLSITVSGLGTDPF